MKTQKRPLSKSVQDGTGGLKCDNVRCDYSDDTPISEYKNCINKPCPDCGRSLLTRADYDLFLKVQELENHPVLKVVTLVLTPVSKVLDLFLKIWKNLSLPYLSVEFNGTGKLVPKIRRKQ